MVKEGYKESEIGIIPQDWMCTKVDDIIQEISMGPFGSDITISNFITSGVPVLNGYNVSAERLKDYFVNHVSPAKAKSLNKAVAHRGDIVVTHRGTIGQISYIPDDSKYQEYVISQSQFRVTVDPNKIIPHFFVLYFRSLKGQYYLLEKKGYTGVPAIAQPTTTFRKLFVPVPTLKEQELITIAFSDMNRLIYAIEKLISKKQAVQQGVMQELLTGKRRLPGFNGEWLSVKLGDISEIKDGTHGTYTRISEGYPLLSAKNVFENGLLITDNESYISAFDYNEIVKNGFPMPGDILLSCVGSIGRCCIYSGNPKVAFQRSVAFIRCNNVDSVFLKFVIQTQQIQKQLQQSANASAQGGIYLGAISKINVFLPTSKKEQEEIAKIFNDMEMEIKILQAKLSKYRSIKQGMMSELLTGKIRLV